MRILILSTSLLASLLLAACQPAHAEPGEATGATSDVACDQRAAGPRQGRAENRR